MNRQVLFVVTSCAQLGDTGEKTGFDLTEVSHPYFVLREAGIGVTFVSPEGGEAPIDPSSRERDDAQGARFLADADAKRGIENTCRPGEVEAKDYDAIFFAGGHGTMWDFPEDEELHRLAAAIYEQGGVVAAICHGPAALLGIKLSNGKRLIEGRRVSAFTDEEEREAQKDDIVPFLLASKLVEMGAVHTKAPPFEDHVEVHGRLITGQNPASATHLGEVLVDALEKQGDEEDAAQ